MGVLVGWMMRNNPEADTWGYHRDALHEYHLLFTDPANYFINLFYTGYSYGYDGVLQFHDSYWNDLKTNLIIKIVSVLHVFSFGNYYVNVVLYNFIVFFGHIALFKFFKNVFKVNTNISLITAFLLPSHLLFSSVIHKEGLVFTAVSFIIYLVYSSTRFSSFTFKKSLLILLSLLTIFFFRNYILVILIPALFAWIVSYKTNKPSIAIFLIVFLGCIGLFFLSPFTPVHLPDLLIQKQADFVSLGKANSTIGVPGLEPTLTSFLINAPKALGHTLFRPWFGDYVLSKPLVLFAFEMMIYYLLFILFFIYPLKKAADKTIVSFLLFFSLFMLLLIGYIVPVLWEIMRYRAIYLPFLIAPFIHCINWSNIPFALRNKEIE